MQDYIAMVLKFTDALLLRKNNWTRFIDTPFPVCPAVALPVNY